MANIRDKIFLENFIQNVNHGIDVISKNIEELDNLRGAIGFVCAIMEMADNEGYNDEDLSLKDKMLLDLAVKDKIAKGLYEKYGIDYQTYGKEIPIIM